MLRNPPRGPHNTRAINLALLRQLLAPVVRCWQGAALQELPHPFILLFQLANQLVRGALVDNGLGLNLLGPVSISVFGM